MSPERKQLQLPEGTLGIDYFCNSLAPISSVPMNVDVLLRKELKRMTEFKEEGFIDDDTEIITKFARDRIQGDLSPYAAVLSIAYMKAVAAAKTYNAWQVAEPNATRDRFCSLNLDILQQNLQQKVASFTDKAQGDEMAEQIMQLVEDRFLNPRSEATFGFAPNDYRDLSADAVKLWNLIICENGDWEFLPEFASEVGFDLESSIQELRTLDLLDETDPTGLRCISFPL